jgi:HlyD family secretion protein
MQLNVDELDIAKVQVGQTETITADAAGGKTYTGIVTKVNINGTTNNGVTAYPVTIRIDETEGLLPV